MTHKTLFAWLKKTFVGGPRRRRLGTQAGAAVCVQMLEDRRMPSAVTASLGANGVLNIQGTNHNDTITVRQIKGNLSVDGVKITFADGSNHAKVAASEVARIKVVEYGGNNTIQLNSQAVAGQQAIHIPALIFGGSGNDTIFGGAGDDVIYAGAGKAVIHGGAGNDTIHAGPGNNVIYAGSGDDVVYGGSGREVIYAREGQDLVYSGPSKEVIYLSNGQVVTKPRV